MSENDDNGNGKKTIEQMAKEKAYDGLIVRASQLHRQDGIITEALEKSIAHDRGVIQTLITAELDDKNYRQILIRARWKNQEQRDKYVKALAICRMVGAKKAEQTLLDLITADTAGDDGALRHETNEMITHTTLTTREELERKKKHGDYKGKTTSPIG